LREIVEELVEEEALALCAMQSTRYIIMSTTESSTLERIKIREVAVGLEIPFMQALKTISRRMITVLFSSDPAERWVSTAR